ncbi:MAG TPA: histidine--tRNA ligase [Solirubrobacteraceae bacterium]|nr:histidine--tRNA ligase [Solirubrobacteraceae bacterium]
MSAQQIRAPRGTHDVLGDQAAARARVEERARALLEGAGYERIETPTFEATELFARGVGASTDIVQKEMYTFVDGSGRSLTLRPEGTAPVCRAYVEHGMHKLRQPVKLWYLSSFFRYERAQAGRQRQFWQVGAEALGADDPAVDAESIVLLARLLEELGVGETRLRLSSLGGPAARAEYRAHLQEHLRAHEDRLAEEVRERIELNPLRAFDSEHPGTRAVMQSAPRLLDHLSPEDAEHFAEVRALLEEAGVAYELDPTLVRGLDYYTRTVFELTSDALGAQSGVGGGGRYDGLVAELGGPPTPGMGWAAGIERILLAGRAPAAGTAAIDLYVAFERGLDEGPPEGGRVGVRAGAVSPDGEPAATVGARSTEGEPGERGAAEGSARSGEHAPAERGAEPKAHGSAARNNPRRAAFRILHEARAAGLAAQMELGGRSLKNQLAHAARLGARYVAIVGAGGAAEETALKDMQARTQQEIPTETVVHAVLRGLRDL